MQNKSINLFAQNAQFIIGAVKVSDLPETTHPEICFIGRSNAGKSSLINAIFNNSKLARVSRTPGCTQQLNFFKISNYFILVDVPGYGYAKASKRKISHWNRLIFDYLRGRPQLYRVYLLADSKVGLKESDIEVIKFLEDYGISCQIIFTKMDNITEKELQKQIENAQKIIKKYINCMPQIIACSALKDKNLQTLRDEITSLIFSVNKEIKNEFI